MKELPYFKFYPAEYLQGDITFENLEVQGAFINICSYYWSKNCQVSNEKLVKFIQKLRVSREKAKKIIRTLIDAKIIKIENENIIIGFLDEQFCERQVNHKVWSEAGRKGGLNKKEATLKPPLENNKPPLDKKEATPKHIDKEEDKDKDKNKIKIKEGKKEIFNALKKSFLKFYKIKKKKDYYFTGKDGAAIKQLISKLEFSIKSENLEISNENIQATFQKLLKENNDKWINDNLSLPIINSKYNEIISKITNSSGGLREKLVNKMEQILAENK